MDSETFYGLPYSFFTERNCAFTSAEIAQQPEIWRRLCDVLTARKKDITGFFQKTGDLKKLRIIFTGAGSSAFAGEAAACILGKVTGLRCEAIPTTDIVSSPDSLLFPGIPTLLVSFARSGNSPESSGAIGFARRIVKNLYEAAILCDGASALAGLTGESPKSLTLVMPEGTNDRGFAMTSSLTSMILACFALFTIERLEEVTGNIRLLVENVERESRGLTGIARKWAGRDYRRFIVLGSGCCKGLAREAALKSMELTLGAVNANYDSALGFRHGPKAVIKDDTLTVHFISADPFTARYDLDLLREINEQKKGNRVIALGPAAPDSGMDENISIPAQGYSLGAELFCGIHCLVFCQLLAMFKSLELKLSTDNPAPAGELTRVVSGVTVYSLEDPAGAAKPDV
jgi:tagatose-6-phosphate ketose/aldose isomerase